MLKSDHQTEIPTLSTARSPQAPHKYQKAHNSGTFTAVHIQLRYVSTVNAVRRLFIEGLVNTCAFRPCAMVLCGAAGLYG